MMIQKNALAYFVCLLFLAACSGNPSLNTEKTFEPILEIEQINSIMSLQQDAWNKGDIETFMQPYWKSDSLIFVGKSGINRGWQNTLDNYKKSYPSPEQMGRLEFENSSIEIFDQRRAWVVGKWTLYRTADTLGGHYTLNWNKKAGAWVITSDHSS
ncbi:MAG: nuclear transport factor 2 family protein [Flavobacteriales bacterium]|nr:nuclear transport factor 2 family protein [Flavobacteriales bacterium]